MGRGLTGSYDYGVVFETTSWAMVWHSRHGPASWILRRPSSEDGGPFDLAAQAR